jgi:DNA-binding response OmpR family regulator
MDDGVNIESADRTIDSHIKRLRKKFKFATLCVSMHFSGEETCC